MTTDNKICRAGTGPFPIFGLALLILANSGCLTSREFQNPFRRQPPCVLSPDATVTDVVNHVNNNINRVHAWKSTDVSIRASGTPIALSASVSVESARHFRLLVNSLGGQEADFGSNDDIFWFWMKRNDPRVFTCRHDEIHVAQQRIDIPFRPDWLMEVLGVVPLVESEFTLQPDLSDSGIVTLVSQTVTTGQEPVRRVVLVDKCRGHVVGHILYDASNQLIAKAELAGHQLDPASQAILPRHIRVEWPRAQLSMQLSMRTVSVNPQRIPQQMWQPPHNVQTVDIAR